MNLRRLIREELGITIIESLIAILVLISATTGAFYLVSRNFSGATVVKDEILVFVIKVGIRRDDTVYKELSKRLKKI